MIRYVNNPYTAAIFITVVVLILPLVLTSNFHLRMVTVLFIYSLVVLGLNLLMGYAGQVSLGHAGFFAMGAYSVAIGPAHIGLNPWVSLIIGIVLTGAVAWLIGRPILRLKGYHLAMATLAFGAIVSMLLNNELRITGGPDGMPVVRANLRSIGLSHIQSWYWICGALLITCVVAIANLLSSPTGRALRAIHDSEIAASVLGIDVARAKLMAFVISAVFAALAGASLALFEGHITPVVGGILRSIEFMTMAVVGGLGSIMGSIVGAAFLVLLPQVLTAFHEYEHAVLGGLLVLTMIFMPRGVIPSLLLIARRMM